jgi:hypothetical protein
MAVFCVVVSRSLVQLFALMMEAACTSEGSVNFFQTTRRNNPEDSHLHYRRRENLKSHKSDIVTLHKKPSVYLVLIPVGQYNPVLREARNLLRRFYTSCSTDNILVHDINRYI